MSTTTTIGIASNEANSRRYCVGRSAFHGSNWFQSTPSAHRTNDRNNARLDDVILALITRTTARALKEPTQFLVDISTSEGKATGLLHDSAVKCEHLLTLHNSFIHRVIGRLSDAMMQQIDACLKDSLALS